MTKQFGDIALAAGGGTLIGMAVGLATVTIERWEGVRADPYRDIVGRWTVCAGETRVKMRRYSRAECAGLLDRALRNDFAPVVMDAVPGISERPYQFAAALSLTYNIGGKAFAGSTIARRFRAGDWRGGCDAFLAWNRAGGKAIRGLERRRADERQLCLTGLA